MNAAPKPCSPRSGINAFAVLTWQLAPLRTVFWLAAIPGVREVHDLHVWDLGAGRAALSAHVLVERDCDCHGVRASLEALLEDRFDLRHTTLQVEHEAPDELLEIAPRTDGRR